MKPLDKPKKRYWDLEEAVTPAGTRTGELYLYGTVYESDGGFFGSPDDVTPKDLVRSLQELGEIDELNVHIFSNGGDVFAGNAIYSLLKQRRETVNVYIEGIAASIASVIAMAGDHIYIAKNAMLMIHNPMVFMFGMFNKLDMAKYITELDRVRDVITFAYTEKTGLSADEINALLDANDGEGTYFDAQEAIQMGFVDALTPDGKAPLEMAAMIRPNVYACRGREIDLSIYKNPPKLKMRAKQKGMTQMAKPKAARKFKAEVATIECPHCQTVLDFDSATEHVTMKPEEVATVAVPLEDNRVKSFKNKLFKISCPACGADFEYETEPDTASQVTVVEPGPAAPLPTQARRKVRAQVPGQPVAPAPDPAQEAAPEPVEIPVTCTACGTEFTIDVDPAIEEVIVPCPNCQTELTVPTTQQEPEPTPAAKQPDEEDEPVAVKAIRNERKRMAGLDDIAKAFPAYANAIEGFKKNGTSVAAAQNWVFKALAANPGASYSAAAKRDAAVLNKVANPVKTNDRSNVIAMQADNLAKMRGVKKDA